MAADEKEITDDLINNLRREIDQIDENIIKLVHLRTERAAQIARLKRGNNIPIVDSKRERDVFGRYAKMLGDLGKTMASAFIFKHRDPETDSRKSSNAETS